MSKLSSVIIGLGAALLLAGCNTTAKQGALPPTVNITPTTPTVTQAGDEHGFRQCREEIISMDRSAAQNASLAQYLAAANATDGCLAMVFNNQSFMVQQQMMQLLGLAVLDYLKGGDIVNARATLARFKQDFGGRDLYFADHSSLIDTFELLLNDTGLGAQQVRLNVNKTLLGEFKRKHYWASH